MSLLLIDATVIDGVADRPRTAQTIWVEGSRIKAITSAKPSSFPPNATVIDVSGKFVMPGLMNANVHLHFAISVERLARHADEYEDIIAESAQIALKNGLTTVFDTWGPRRPLMNVRDRIEAGSIPGSRIYCAGNIIGFDGPLSPDFRPAHGPSEASDTLTSRVNEMWVENVGRHLMWLAPEDVRRHVRAYIAKGIDFVKYASNEHLGAFLAFSPEVQAAIIDESHRSGLTAQAHCCTIEGLRIAIEAGCDLITHANFTGPTPIPAATLEQFVKRDVGAVIFPFTQRRLDWFFSQSSYAGFGADLAHTKQRASDRNARNFIQCGARLLLANDACVFPPEVSIAGRDVDDPLDLAQGHFLWFEAMEEKGCAPMEMLRAATCNIARTYRLDKDLGTIEEGKLADLVILDKNPLDSARNYRSIHAIVKAGRLVDRDALPLEPILTHAPGATTPEERGYIPYVRAGMAPMCLCG